jgi:hypothetical protein
MIKAANKACRTARISASCARGKDGFEVFDRFPTKELIACGLPGASQKPL